MTTSQPQPRNPYRTRRYLEAALVARALLDPTLFDRWTEPRVSPACDVVLDVIAQHHSAATACLVSTVSVSATLPADADPDFDEETIARAIRLARRAVALPTTEVAFVPLQALMRWLGAKPVVQAAARRKRPAKWERDLHRVRLAS